MIASCRWKPCLLVMSTILVISQNLFVYADRVCLNSSDHTAAHPKLNQKSHRLKGKAMNISTHNQHHLEEVEYQRIPEAELRKLHQDQARTNEISTSHSPAPMHFNNSCSFAMKELDRCSSQLIGLGQRHQSSDETNSLPYPDSMQDLNSVYCPRFRNSVNCIKNQIHCFKPFERQVIVWILTSTRKMNYRRCKNENEKVRFLRLTNSCFASMKDPMDKCMRNYIGLSLIHI